MAFAGRKPLRLKDDDGDCGTTKLELAEGSDDKRAYLPQCARARSAKKGCAGLRVAATDGPAHDEW
jgi:hypothetical protein